MKPQITVTIGVLIFITAVVAGTLTSQKDTDEPLTVNTVNQSQTSNTNIGIPQTYGQAIVFTGKVIPFTSAFQEPDTTGWKSYTVFERDVAVDPKFTACYWDILGSDWYFVIGACEENQDAPSLRIADITEKVNSGDPNLRFKYAKDVEVPLEHQFQSDEIRGTVNGHNVWCYDDSQARYCEIRRSDGKVYFANGGYFHEAGKSDQESFKSLVLAFTRK